MDPLNELQRRVLGVLIEKQLSQPQYYPLTLNALVNGCNQKSNRDPTMELDEATVYDTLEELRGRDLISRVLAGAGSRTDRFRHDLGRTVGWQTPQLAIMAELLLRGPQTVGELRSRCARMHAFASTDAVAETLESLAGGDSPVVMAMPREAGRSAIRHRHLLYEAGEAPKAQPAAVGGITAAPPQARSASPAQVAAIPHDELENIQAEIGELHEEIADLRRRLESLEELVGR